MHCYAREERASRSAHLQVMEVRACPYGDLARCVALVLLEIAVDPDLLYAHFLVELDIDQVWLRPVRLPVRVGVVVPGRTDPPHTVQHESAGRRRGHVLLRPSQRGGHKHRGTCSHGCVQHTARSTQPRSTQHRHLSCSTPFPGLAVLSVHTASPPISRLSLSWSSALMLPSSTSACDASGIQRPVAARAHVIAGAASAGAKLENSVGKF